jgi:dihydropyrimidine dehydrogenase (NAD+) subunit PreA
MIRAGRNREVRGVNFREARDEATRCLLCHDAPCHAACPARIDPSVFIRKIRFGNLAGAARHLRRANPLAAACAQLCPTLDLCAGACLSAKLTQPIDIGGLQRFVCEWEREQGGPAVGRLPSTRERVAVIGAGPAGLTAAAELARRGFAVTLFDREAEAGGILHTAIPAYRLDPQALAHDAAQVVALGIDMRLGREIASAEDLLTEGFAAVFVALGAGRSATMGIPGEDHARVHPALAFMIAAKRGAPPRPGRRVAVIGGGDIAIDAARLARRMGHEVTLLYRRGREALPAYRPDADRAWDEGVEFLFHVLPLGFEHADGSGGAAPGDLAGVRLQRVAWDSPGREARAYHALGEPFLFPCDDVLVAIGLRATGAAGLPLDERGLIRHDRVTLMTEHPGIFAGGDVASGPGIAVRAVAMGKSAAEQIDEHLTRSAAGEAIGGAGATAPTARATTRDIYPPPRASLAVTFCGVRFENPFVLAAAPPTDDLEMVRDAFRAGWAGAVLKTTSVAGTPVPLVYPMITGLDFEGRRVSGLGNIDLISEHTIDVVAERVRALKCEFPTKVVAASIMGATQADWQSLARRLEEAGVDLIECSFSCPQGTLGSRPGAMLGQDPLLVRRVAEWVKAAAGRVPIVIKLTPQVTDIVETARAVKAAGCDAICASNTIPALMGIDLGTRVPEPDVQGRSTCAGLSGPAIKPITLRTISQIATQVDLPITGTGGPVTWSDAVEFMLAGATTVQFCTAVMRFGFDIIDDLCEGMRDYLDRRGLDSPQALIGGALPQIVSHAQLPRGARVTARIDDERCIRDGACFIACRDGGHRAIRMGDERRFEIDPQRCVGCGLCRLVCPVDGCILMQVSDGPAPVASS